MQGFEWGDLQIFLALYRGKSIRAAAISLGVSHSTVSRRLAGMEDSLKVKLFARSAEGLMASTAAETMIARAERVESEILNLQRDVVGQDTLLAGPVRITMPPSVAQHLIMPHLAEFADLYPDVALEVVSTYRIADMSRRDADIAIRFQEAPNGDLFGRRLPSFADGIYGAPHYVEKHSFTGSNPTGHWLGWGEGERSPKWALATPFDRCTVLHETHGLLAQVEAVKAGLGMAILPCFLGDADPALMRVPGAGIIEGRPGWVLTHPDLKTSERVRACVRFLVQKIETHTPLVSGHLEGERPVSNGALD